MQCFSSMCGGELSSSDTSQAAELLNLAGSV